MCPPSKQLLEKYREVLEDMARKHSSEPFTNKGKEYASILMSVLFQNTEHQVRMFAYGFRPDLIMTPPYWNTLKEYINDTDKPINVLVETNEFVKEEPMRFLANAKERGRKNINVRLISEEQKKQIQEKMAPYAHCNFSVFDDNMYRMEFEPEEFKAFGSFNDKKECERLIGIFDNAYKSARVII